MAFDAWPFMSAISARDHCSQRYHEVLRPGEAINKDWNKFDCHVGDGASITRLPRT